MINGPLTLSKVSRNANPPIKKVRDSEKAGVGVSSAKKGAIAGKLIETDYFETGSTETICSAGPYSIAPGLKCSGRGIGD